MTIIEQRASEPIVLARGVHRASDGEMCLLEATAWIAGEPWSDHPECVCPVIAAFGRSWNDALSDDDRNRLLAPYITKLVGTRSTPEIETRRSWMATDWLVRTFAPAWLRRAGLDEFAESLENLPELTSDELAETALPIISAAYSAARSAAYPAAYPAARSAAYSAAYPAACSAAYSAARSAAYSAAYPAAYPAARSAAYSAARSAAYSAAYPAACSAAYSALAETVVELQLSACGLMDRMIGAK